MHRPQAETLNSELEDNSHFPWAASKERVDALAFNLIEVPFEVGDDSAKLGNSIALQAVSSWQWLLTVIESQLNQE